MGEAKKLCGFVCVLGCLAPLFAQEAPAAWFPITVGNRWTYEHEVRDGNPKEPRIFRWQTEETITGTLALTEGTVVLRNVNVVGNSPGSWLSRYGESHYLVRNSCLYFLDPAYSWSEEDRQLSPEFRAKLLNGEELPAFCFPLVPGKKFATELPPGFTPSKVAGMGGGSGFTPASVTGKAFRVEVHLFEADNTRLWFEKGVGVTGIWDWHRGAYSEYRVNLVRFQPSPAHAQTAAGVPVP